MKSRISSHRGLPERERRLIEAVAEAMASEAVEIARDRCRREVTDGEERSRYRYAIEDVLWRELG